MTKSITANRAPTVLPALLDAVPLHAAVASPHGSLLYCNQSLASIIGWSGLETTPRHLVDILGAENSARLLRKPGDTATVRASLKTPDQSHAPEIEWSSRPLVSEEWNGNAVLVTGRDIQRELALENYIVENQWFETAGALAGGLAHDFNNVLASVLGLSEIIGLRLPPSSPLRPLTVKISEGIDRAKILVRRFTQFSRKSAPLVEAQPLGLVVDDIRHVLTGFLPGSIVFETSISPDTPWCHADRHLLGHILLNCANFFRTKLRDDGGRLEIRTSPRPKDGQAVVSVCGSGAGLVKVDSHALFVLRPEPTGSAYESGAALFAAQRLARSAGLELMALREDPRTITFELRLPVAPA